MGLMKNLFYIAVAASIPVVGVAAIGLLYDGDDPGIGKPVVVQDGRI